MNPIFKALEKLFPESEVRSIAGTFRDNFVTYYAVAIVDNEVYVVSCGPFKADVLHKAVDGTLKERVDFCMAEAKRLAETRK